MDIAILLFYITIHQSVWGYLINDPNALVNLEENPERHQSPNIQSSYDQMPQSSLPNKSPNLDRNVVEGKHYLTNSLQDQHSNKLQLRKIRIDEPNHRFPTSDKDADIPSKEIDSRLLHEQSIQIRQDPSENSYIQDRLLEPVVYTSQNYHLKYDYPENRQRILLEPSLQYFYEQKTPFVNGIQSNHYLRDIDQRSGKTKQSMTERLDDKTHIHQLTKAMSKHYSKTLSKIEADIRENSERIIKQQTLFQTQGNDLENIGRDVGLIGKKIEAQEKRLDSLKHVTDSQGLEIEFIVAMFRKYELQIKHQENILKGIARQMMEYKD